MSTEQPDILRLNPADNVALALRDLAAGEEIDGQGLTCDRDIPRGHKLAVRAIAPDEPILKYGQIIGFAAHDIKPGEYVHVHNLTVKDFARDYAFGRDARPTDFIPEADRAVFQGYVRDNGRIATRNYIGILTTVSCSATVARQAAARFGPKVMAAYPHVDGVVAFGHGLGCGMGSSGDVYDYLQRSVAGFARHPNFAGVVIIGLGCEVNRIDDLTVNQNLIVGDNLATLNIQDTGGTVASVEAAVQMVQAMLPRADRARRTDLPVSQLMVGLECGGSDALSGVTANPALGAAVDLLVRQGGTAILSETPEIYGAEHLLTRRAVSEEVGRKLVERIEWWEDYTARNGAELNNNPTPGNKAGGLSSILEKSLGAQAKGGTTNLVEVYRYAEAVDRAGLVFMDTPGYDVTSITGMIAGGANVICFTTGRGSVVGSIPAPTIKLATNSPMYQRLRGDMDLNCGPIVDSGVSVEAMGRVIFDEIVAVASGKKSKSEALGFGEAEFAPWMAGAMV